MIQQRSVYDFYTDGTYTKNNPGWHIDDAPWKTQAILALLERHHLRPATICDIGCGAGEILRLIQQRMDETCSFVGYDIAPDAIFLAQERVNDRLQFKLADFLQERDVFFDLILLIDVIAHFENCFQVLRDLKPKSEYKILQFPLDISASAVMRNELISYRRTTQHRHFFTRDIALEILREAGYEVLAYQYVRPPLDATPWSVARKSPGAFLVKCRRLLKRGLQGLPGTLLYRLHKDLAVRLFGGWRLLVLVK